MTPSELYEKLQILQGSDRTLDAWVAFYALAHPGGSFESNPASRGQFIAVYPDGRRWSHKAKAYTSIINVAALLVPPECNWNLEAHRDAYIATVTTHSCSSDCYNRFITSGLKPEGVLIVSALQMREWVYRKQREVDQAWEQQANGRVGDQG